MRIAIFGGTFNPFHIGHYEMLKSVCELQFVDKVLVIPDHIPPHKEALFLATDEDRLKMCEIVCADFEKAQICDIELKREGKSYTIYTVKELKKIYKDDIFYFVCGGDMINILDKWFEYETLFKELKFLAFSRNDNESFLNDVEKMRSLGADITVIDKPIPDVSSTDFRNKKTKKLLPKKVYEYIESKGIYNA